MISSSHLITYIVLALIPATVSITFNLTNIGPKNENQEIVIEGDGAYISDDGIHLTPNQSNKAGRATYVRELHLWDKTSGELASFSTNFTFVINSNGVSDYGDGFTFFLAQKNYEIYNGRSLGLPDPDNGTTDSRTTQYVAVEFDTFWNLFIDPVNSSDKAMGDHVGIDVNSIVSVRSLKWLSNISGGGVCQAWINYDSASKNLSVSFTGFRNNKVVRQDGLYYNVDLRFALPEWVMFGFSGATGFVFQENKVRSWFFNSSDLKVDSNHTMPLSPSPSPNFHPGKPKNSKVGLVVGLLVSFAFLTFVAIGLWRWKKNRSMQDDAEEVGLDVEMMNDEFEMGTGPKKFTYHELAQSTGNFSDEEKLGEGGFGSVYRGFLKDSSIYVAVKRVSKGSRQGIKEYISEVRIISRLRHRNLVQLIGWCHQKGDMLLVYEYMENGSLDLHLFKGKSLLTWGTRSKIIHGLASALLYLHEEWEQCVLHRDIKPSNVMLDLNFNAKLGDFGLAKLVDHDKGSQTTMLAGTLGYMAPECVVTGKASKESDVYSFGVVILEIVCGKKSIESIEYKAQEKQIRLLEWVWELNGTGKLLEAIDSRLGMDFEEGEIGRMMILGLLCAHPDSKLRPSMRQVIPILNSEASLPTLPSSMPVASYLTPSSIVQNQPSSSSSNTDLPKQTTISIPSSYLDGR